MWTTSVELVVKRNTEVDVKVRVLPLAIITACAVIGYVVYKKTKKKENDGPQG